MNETTAPRPMMTGGPNAVWTPAVALEGVTKALRMVAGLEMQGISRDEIGWCEPGPAIAVRRARGSR